MSNESKENIKNPLPIGYTPQIDEKRKKVAAKEKAKMPPKTWTVLYRDNTGRQQSKFVEALDRAELFDKLKELGINAIRVDEAKDKVRMIIPKPNGRTVTFIVAGIAVIILATLAWVLFSSPTEENSETKTIKKIVIAEIKPSIPTNKVEKTPPEVEKGVRYTRKGTKINVPKNPFGTPIPKDLEYKPFWEYTEEDCARVDPGYAARHEKFLARESKRTFHTGVDRTLAVALFSEPGQPSLLIPFSPSFKDQFLKSLETPIIVSEDDPPEVREQKRQMIDTKIWLKEQMDDGKDIVEILNEEVACQNEIRTLRENLLRELHDLRRSDATREELQDYVNAANIMLEQAGGAKVSIPMINKKKMYLNTEM